MAIAPAPFASLAARQGLAAYQVNRQRAARSEKNAAICRIHSIGSIRYKLFPAIGPISWIVNDSGANPRAGMRPASFPRRRGFRLVGLLQIAVDRVPHPVNDSVMDLDELFAKRPDDPLTQLVTQDLDPLSVEELRERMTILEGEIARVNQKIEASVNFRASADSLFKGGGGT